MHTAYTIRIVLGGCMYFLLEKRLLTLFLDTQKLRNFLISVKNEAMVDALWCVYAYQLYHIVVDVSYTIDNYCYIGLLYTCRREASALLVQQRWAMRRPLSVERVAAQILTLFLFLQCRIWGIYRPVIINFTDYEKIFFLIDCFIFATKYIKCEST